MGTEYLSGKRELISIGKETSYGSAVTPTLRLGLNARVEPNYENRLIEVSGAGTDETTVSYQFGRKLIKGTLSFVPQDWKMLVFAIGTTTNTGSNPYTHTFSQNSDKTLMSFTLERGISATTNRVKTFIGCMVNTLTLSWNAGGTGTGSFISCSINFVAKDVSNGTSITSLTPSSKLGFKNTNVILTLNSTVKTRCISGSLTINNNLSDGMYSCYDSSDRLISEPQAQKVTFEGEFVLHYTDDTEFEFWNNGVVIPGTNTLEFKRGSDDKLVATFSNLRVETLSDPTNLDGFNQVTLRWRADNITFVATDDLNDYITA